MLRYCLIGLTGILAATASAFVTPITATADGDVQFSGSLGFTVDDAATSVRAARSGGNNVRNGVFEFDLSALPAGATITGASLELTTSGLISNTGATADVFIDAFTGDGVILDSDHENNTTGTQVAADTYATGGSGTPIGTLLTINLTDITPLQTALDDASTAFATLRTRTVNFVNFSVHSIDTATSGVIVPTLTVTWVPEPASLVLLALSGLLMRRR